jgi:multidrug efflux pump subunit AcrA (membrane-fusion protein)
LAGLTIAAVVLTVGGFAAGRFVRSPAQVAAEAEPPEPTLITAQVVRGEISKTVIARGDVVPSEQVTIAAGGGWLRHSEVASPAVGAVVPPAANGGAAVLTGSFVEVGDEVAEGQVIVEVSERPVFALQGDAPLTRDLRPGATGGDVLRLQEALARLGLFGGRLTGVFGAATQEAVVALYGQSGYEPVATDNGTGEDEDALAAADLAVARARSGAVDANWEVVRANDQVVAAEAGVRSAKRLLEESQANKKTASEIAQAQDDLAAAERALAAAERDLRAAEDTAAAAAADVAAAAAARDRLLGRIGPIVPMAEFGFAPALPAAVTAVADEIGFEVPEPLITLTPKALVVRVAGLAGVGSGVVGEGNPVELAMPGGEVKGGHVASVAPAADGGVGLDIEITPDAPLEVALAGENIKVTFVEAATDGEVLGVPQGAISSDSAGTLSVVVVEGQDEASGRPVLRRVEIEVGVAGTDLVEVRPLRADQLADGMRVVIGG